MIKALIGVVYVLIGVVVASSNQYLSNIDDLTSLVAALLAILLWPLVLIGVDLHLGQLVNKE